MRIIHCLLLSFALAASLKSQGDMGKNNLTAEPGPVPETPSPVCPKGKSTAITQRETWNLSGLLKNIHNPILGLVFAGMGVGYMYECRTPGSFFLACACLFFSVVFSAGDIRSRIQDE